MLFGHYNPHERWCVNVVVVMVIYFELEVMWTMYYPHTMPSLNMVILKLEVMCGRCVRQPTPIFYAKVLVMSAKQMQWILEHDYGADGEVRRCRLTSG